MKIASILACALPFLLLGCKREARSAQSPPPPPAQSKTVSSGGVTWHLGAATMNGTNVGLSNISIRAVTNQGAKYKLDE